MWIFGSDYFVSVVADRESKDRVLVRSRLEGDIQRFLGGESMAEVFEDGRADYFYRAFVHRDEFEAAMARHAKGIDYDNFKSTVSDEQRHRLYMNVWSIMEAAQRRERLGVANRREG